MKKILLSVLILGLGLPVLSQKRLKIPKEKYLITKTATAFVAGNSGDFATKPANPYVSNPASIKCENEIGTTKYDMQSTAALANRLWLFDDGTAAAVWTMGFEADDFLDRGTGYNYFNGDEWGPAPNQRIESVRTGWPSIAAWGENGEIIVSHNISPPNWTEDGLVICRRPEKGTGEWTESMLPGPENLGGIGVKWPRIMTSGENHNYIHIIVPADNACQGQDKPLLYIRSDDGGETWTDWTILDEINSDYYSGFTADEYTWAESTGDVIAFTIANPWHDWIVMKSTDNGENWEKIVIWEHPYPMFDWQTTITTDTVWAPDNSVDIALDDNGMVHAVCGLTRVMHTSPGITYSYFPWTDGIVYWNETMPPFTAENQHRALAYENLTEDETLIGWVADNGPLLEELQPYRELGMSTMPNITADDGQVVVVWSSVTEGYDNGVYNFRHIWMRRSYDNGNANTWGVLIDMDADISHWLDECIYPVMASSFDVADNAFFIYNIDATPGTAVDGDHDYQTNTIFFEGPFICQNPNIWVHPYSFTIIKPAKNISNNKTGSYFFTIGNSGSANLDVYSVTGSKPWITGLGPASKLIINPGDSVIYSFDVDWSQINYGSDTATISIYSNDMWNMVEHISVTAIINEAFLYTDVSEIDLGTEGPVYPFNTVFTIKNTGNDTLTGNINENLQWITSVSPESFTLATFEEQEIAISGFFPDEPGEFSGLVNIYSNGGDTTILIHGIAGGQSVLLISPTIFDLGIDSSGAIFTESFTVKNTGNELITGNIYENAGWISSVTPDTIALETGEEMTVAFEGNFPEDSGYFSTYINVVTNIVTQQIFISGVAGNVSVPENSLTDNLIIIYPNPVVNEANLELILLEPENVKVSIYNQTGQIVYIMKHSLKAGRQLIRFDISRLAKGIYLLKINEESNQLAKRFIKQ